ncbi:O-antigen ligase family protein [Microbacterium sp. NPDC087591]|uniref:O-antigen ligase family protein n=1 Tax=Microbacterium sp. NPDC087591 TaxID=3364192 RepID=UPI00382EBB9B
MTKREWLGPASLALLTCVGQLKENPLLQWVPVDLTLLVFGLVLIMVIRARLIHGPTTGRVLIPWALWGAFIPAVALSDFDSYSTTKITTLFTVTLILAIAPFYLLREPSQRVAFLRALAVVAVIIAVLALLNPSTSASYTNRLTLEGADTIGTARVSMAGAVILTLTAFQRGIKPIWRIGMVLLAGMTAMLGVLSGSRGPVIAGVAAIVVVIAIAPAMKRYRGRALISAGLLGIVVVWIAIQNESDGLNRIASILTGEPSTSSNIRSSLWETGLDRLIVTPLGAGWGGYESAGSIYRYPHNLLIEVGIEGGWLLLLVVTVLIIATLIRGVMVAKNTSGVIFLGLFIFSIINVMVSGDINGTRLFWPVLFVMWVIPASDSEPWFYSSSARRAREAYAVRVPITNGGAA